jgi:tetratricopeptide (TPR) repeat protein
MRVNTILLLIAINLLPVHAEEKGKKYQVPDIPIYNEWKNVILYHADFTSSNLKLGDHVEAGEKIGSVQSEPKTFSNRFNNEILKSQQDYKQQDYKNAIDILKRAIVEESRNPFVLNNYARACYWEHKEESYRTYKKLIQMLDSTYDEPGTHVSIDLWFREAYWKLGTLYMDNSEYDKAYFEISRSIAAMQDLKGEFIYCQALSFLTECAYMMQDEELARYLADRTLFYDPKNTYVREYIDELNKTKKRKK